MLDAGQFSKFMKIQKVRYQLAEEVIETEMEEEIDQLKKVSLSSLQKDRQKLAFWINVYNGMTNYLIIRNKLKQHMKEIPDFFAANRLEIGGYWLSLDDIEHGILRRNARRHLSADSAILAWQVEHLDYRIHFALNCGALSCPPIAYYQADRIDQQLAMAMDSFIGAEFIVNEVSKTIVCSALFDWYREDFVGAFLNDPSYEGFQVQLKPYDWSI
ncbi:MAG: DUF547 domain-containing protein [Saprospiraceae bacterium]|nr:DUF547 domain-containing protein [Saprospiraceae bacterium]